jgi:hypothetical protein
MSQSKKTAIPAPGPSDSNAVRAMKQQLEVMNGTIGGPLAQVPSNASLAQVIVAINQIITRLNA